MEKESISGPLLRCYQSVRAGRAPPEEGTGCKTACARAPSFSFQLSVSDRRPALTQSAYLLQRAANTLLVNEVNSQQENGNTSVLKV